MPKDILEWTDAEIRLPASALFNSCVANNNPGLFFVTQNLYGDV